MRLLVCLIMLLQSTGLFAQLNINEWMASNSSIISDPDFDNTGDWAEIYNSGESDVNLTDHYLTDNTNNPGKWEFPAGTIIPAKGFLLVWLDGENNGLHANFKLTKAGEELALYDPSLVQLHHIQFGTQKTNVSMGSITDGDADLGFFTEPTPGESNTTIYYEGITFFKPIFSSKGGFYESQMSVSLSSLGGEIRYTLDGSAPTSESDLYISPIALTETTTIRATVFEVGHIPGLTRTHTYFLEGEEDSTTLPIISISTDEAYFWDADIGLYVQDFKPDWEYPINVELFENDGSDRAVINELAGVRVNGLNSWELPQKMLGIYFDNEYENNNIDYNLFFDRDRKRFDNFILRASGSDWSFTLFRDALCQALSIENMDLERMGYRPSIVYVNGDYLGIHNIRSRIDEGFIEDNFGLAGGSYDLIENNGVVEEGDNVAFHELFDLFETDLSDPVNYQKVDSLMDVENFMDYFITEIWCSNSSWGHNIQLWKPKAAGSKWRWILQDFDRGFSGSENNGIDYFSSGSQPSYYAWARVALNGMLQNQDFAERFAQRFADHLYTNFHPKQVKKLIAEFGGRIEQEISRHVERWAGTTSNYGDGIESVAFWENEVEKLRNFAEEREVFMIGELQEKFNYGNEASLGILSIPNDAGKVMINENIVPESDWLGTYFRDLDFELLAMPKAGFDFEGWSSASFIPIVEAGSDWKYLDDGSDQGSAWRTVDYEDDNWKEGLAELGYGDGDEETVVEYGDPASKHITTYFRKKITIEQPEKYSDLVRINLKRDDGAVVYLNGEELFRTNLPDGVIAFDTPASDFIGGSDEDNYVTFTISTAGFLVGDNIIAVEIHQYNGSSSDISFDLELQLLDISDDNIISSAAALPVILSSDSIFIARYEGISDCFLPRIISEDTHLTADCSPYYASTDVQVLEDVELVVEEGVEIFFQSESSLIVNGTLQINGTESQPVIFASIYEDVPWGAIVLRETSGASNLNWLTIANASRGEHPVYEDAAISAFQADVYIDHLTCVDVQRNPILTRYSKVQLTNSTLHSKVTGDLINVKYGMAEIDNCVFLGNDQVDTDAIDYDEVENGIIRNSKIYDFKGFNSDGIDLGEECDHVLVENNFIQNCTDKAISVGQASRLEARNNTIVDCQQGISVKDISQAWINKNTFYNVAIPINCFEKNPGDGGGSAMVENCILSNSPVAPSYQDQYSIIEFVNTLSDTEEILGTSNLFGNPQFINPTGLDFHLMEQSPAISAGVENGSAVDLGTDFFDYTGESKVHFSGINYHPQDSTESEFLQIYNPSATHVLLDGYRISEGIEFVFPDVQIAPGETIWLVENLQGISIAEGQVFQWTNGKLSNDGELIVLTDANGIIVDHVRYNDKLPWPEEADGNGAWLCLLDHRLDNHFAESWKTQELVSVIGVQEQQLRIFPSPTNGQLIIESSEKIELIQVFSQFGNRIFHVEGFGQSSVELDLSNLDSGIYFVKINDHPELNRFTLVR